MNKILDLFSWPFPLLITDWMTDFKETSTPDVQKNISDFHTILRGSSFFQESVIRKQTSLQNVHTAGLPQIDF